MPAAIRCLHQPLGALGKSLHSHVPLHTTYSVVPLDCEATLALPPSNSSTSPASTSATALSTRPLHSGRVALAFSAISATATRHARCVVVSNSGALASSHVISFTATIDLPFLSQRVGYDLAVRCYSTSRPNCVYAMLSLLLRSPLRGHRPSGLLSRLPSWPFSLAR